MKRRQFLTAASLGTGATWATLHTTASAADRPKESPAPARPGQHKLVAFTKSFQDWPIPVVCQRFREIGLQGLDLTVRQGGMILPKDAPEQLPLAAKAAAEAGMEIPLLTTLITELDEESQKLLATASKLGIRYVKIGYFKYKPFGTLASQIDDARRQLAVLVKAFKKYDVLPCVHIHSGTYIPSHGTMLYQLLRDFAPSEVGAYGDMLHMALEGGGDGWRQGLDLIAPWLVWVAVKNFDWQAGDRDANGWLRWKTRVVPVADGISPIPDYVALLKKMGFSGGYSMHSEYKGKHSFKDLDTEACLAQTAADLKFIKPLLDKKA
jgi:sugar phosphate isomerase/epimerase